MSAFVPWTDPGGTPCCCLDCYDNNDIITGSPEAPHSLLQWFDVTPATYALLLAGGNWVAKWSETVTCFETSTLTLFPTTETATVNETWSVTTTSPNTEFALTQIYPDTPPGNAVCHFIGKASNIPIEKTYTDSGRISNSTGQQITPPSTVVSTGTTAITFVAMLNNEQRINFTTVHDPANTNVTSNQGRAMWVAPIAIQRFGDYLQPNQPIWTRLIGYRLGNFLNNYPDTISASDLALVGSHTVEFAEPNVSFSAVVNIGTQTFYPTPCVNVRLSSPANDVDGKFSATNYDFLFFASWPRYYVNGTNYFGGGASLEVTFVPNAP